MKMFREYKWEDFSEDIIDLALVLLGLAVILGVTLWVYGVMGWL